MEIKEFLNHLQNRMKIDLTDEQLALCEHFNTTCLCFASPGTGKTATAVAGLATAELFYKKHNIYAMSFTNNATGELRNRYKALCETIHIRDNVTFKTLHSICTELLRKYKHLIGMPNLSVQGEPPLKRMLEFLTDASVGMNLTPQKLKKVLYASRQLNASLTFDPISVTNSYAFQSCGVEYSEFNYLRQKLYGLSRVTNKVVVSDILLYTLHLLIEHPEVAEEFRNNCDFMLVDEAQDLSVLQLYILSLLCRNIVFIGDMKQQIYGFAGASPMFVEQYYHLFPQGDTLYLTKSFRCKNNIANYANGIIQHGSDDDSLLFSGCADGGEVRVTNNLNLHELVSEIAEKYFSNKRNFDRDIMFLYRNNMSLIPIVEELYKAQVPFRSNKFTRADEMPVIKDLVELALLAYNPTETAYLPVLNKILPEFYQYDKESHPLGRIIRKTNTPIFEINYRYKDADIANQLMTTLLNIHSTPDMSMTDILNKLYVVYNKTYLANYSYLLEYPAEYYINAVNPAIHGKTLRTFLQQESEKERLCQEYTARNIGIRCYTMHASKGLEADDVYVLYADAELIPNQKVIDKLIKADCLNEAIRDYHSERCLTYVAATRARSNLTIHYFKDLSPLFTEHSTPIEDRSENAQRLETDVEAFVDFVNDVV